MAKTNSPMRDMERAIIGSMLSDNVTAWDLIERLRPEMFQDLVCRSIFTASQAILAEGKSLSVSMIAGRIPDLDNATAVVAVIMDCAEPGVVYDFVDTIQTEYKRRCAVSIAGEFQAAVAKENADIDQVAVDYQAKLADLTISSGGGVTSLDEILGAVIEKGRASMETEFRPGFDTGLHPLDEILGLIMPGDLGAICGAPGEGKTVLALQIAMRAADLRNVAVFEFEMQEGDLGRRILSGAADVSVESIASGEMDYLVLEKMHAAREAMKQKKLDVITKPMNMAQIRNKCMAIKKRRGLDLVVIDHLRLIKASSKRMDKWERMEEAAEECKTLAKELNVAVVLLSQRTKESQKREDPTPRLTDLDGGGALEMFADWVVAIFRRDRWISQTYLGGDTRKWRSDPEEKDPGGWFRKYSDCEGRAELYTLKRRRGADMQKRIVRFDGRLSKFTALND